MSTPRVALTGTILSMVDPAQNPATDDAPPLMGTGSLCFSPTFTKNGVGLDTAHSVVSSPIPSLSAPGAPAASSAQQLLVGSALEAFHSLRFRFAPPSLVGTPALGALSPSPSIYNLTSAALDTATGRLTASYDVKLASTQLTFCQVTHTVTPLRHSPSFVMHTVNLTVDVSLQSGFRVYHDVRADSALTGVRFSGQMFHLPAPTTVSNAVSKNSHYTLVGTATHAASGRSVQQVSAYDVDGDEAQVVGFNVVKRVGMPDYAYTRIDCKLVTTSMSGGSHTYTFNVLSGTAVDGTIDGLQRIAMSFFVRGLDPVAISAASDAAWEDTWMSEVVIEAKSGLAPNSMEMQRVQRCQRALRVAMYNIHVGASDRGSACVVDGYAAFRKVGATDAFIVPILTLLFPGSALAAMGSRYDSLPAARSAANMAGLKGARFLDVPCAPIGGGSDESVSIEGISSLQLAVTALVGLNAWNYYRVSTDRDWLVSQGYTILKEAADALVTASTVIPNGDPNESPQYIFPGLIGLDGTAPPATDNALTVAAAKIALRGAVEASYLLGYTPKQSWIDLRDSVDLPIFPVPPATVAGIVRRDADSDSSKTATFLEPLMVLTPWLNNGSYVSGAQHSVNLQYWASHASPNPLPANPNAPGQVALPINVLLLTQAQAMLAQQVSQQNALTEATNFDAAIHAFLDACSDDAGWGNLAAEGEQSVGSGPNDLSLSCAFVLMLMQGLAGVTVTGGISDSKYLYQPMGISIGTTAVLPPDWARLRINGIGRRRSDYDVVNQLLIPNNYNNNSYIPWSVNMLTF